ncbi:hypothetical protein LTR78_003344 [Recurvomyces mirabilis]|uniref:Zn(2)-C6 fungal-type domain-containing protein n=1 Tax=Recurvomyces mirabilis TaxID=574656 RepID=A0AAE0WRA4_9PEZI|nr:hypothetical protein LTR78_003344 [Recurvomyces mirabilis]KAK5154620.1 hypothetical protein LTS14_006758 [Recurvomyces mirabilis]
MDTSWGPEFGHTTSVEDPATEQMQRSSSREGQKKPQSRQLLSCTKCRERKVKCDRTKPCSACCARGHPKDCEFVVGEGNDYSPIQQSYEIRKLRQENQRLKERLQAARLSHSGDEEDDEDAFEQKGSKNSRSAAAKQRRFKTTDRVDNLYFGTPSLANIVHDFANLHVGSHSLTHRVPKASEVYGIDDSHESMFPFPIFNGWTGSNTATTLVNILRGAKDIPEIVDAFQARAQSCSFPHTPEETTKKEIQRFLDDAESNASRHPDMLALIFATLATGLQMGEYDRAGGSWVRGSMAEIRKRADVYLAASMHALRMSSYMSQPSLLGIQTLVLMGPYLTNSGRFLDAWTLFGTTIRLAHSIGLHRNPQYLDSTPSLRESMTRRTLWWWMLHMDQQYSVTLGRPLGISGMGDCPPPEPLVTNPTMLRLGEFVDHFTILARQILSSDGLMSVSKIDEYTDKLLGLWDTMPAALQFNESWVQKDAPLPDWPLDAMSAILFAKVQSFLVLLNRQRVERTQHSSRSSPPGGMMRPPASTGPLSSVSSSSSELLSHPASVRGRDLVINSSASILQTFLFFWHRNPAILISWTMGQQAFNACMILIIDIWETEAYHNQWIVQEAFVVFNELADKGIHSLAALAVNRISDGLFQLGQRQEERRVANLSRRSSAQQHQGPMLQLDTASLADWSANAVMGNTGMYLLEDPGLQVMTPQSFQPLGWNMAGAGQPLPHSNNTTPNLTPPTVPVSQVHPAPFPVISPPFMPKTIPVTNSPYAVGLQPRMPVMRRASAASTSAYTNPSAMHIQQAAFTPINTYPQQQTHVHQMGPQQQQQQQHSFSQLRGPRPAATGSSTAVGRAGGGPQGIHKLDRTPGRSKQRRR